METYISFEPIPPRSFLQFFFFVLLITFPRQENYDFKSDWIFRFESFLVSFLLVYLNIAKRDSKSIEYSTLFARSYHFLQSRTIRSIQFHHKYRQIFQTSLLYHWINKILPPKNTKLFQTPIYLFKTIATTTYHQLNPRFPSSRLIERREKERGARVSLHTSKKRVRGGVGGYVHQRTSRKLQERGTVFIITSPPFSLPPRTISLFLFSSAPISAPLPSPLPGSHSTVGPLISRRGRGGRRGRQRDR